MTRQDHLACALAVVARGIGVRFVDVGPPAPVATYAGSAPWSAMVWLLVGAAAPTSPSNKRLPVALAIAGAVECFRLYQTPPLDAFRRTLAGHLLLGRVFAVANIVACAVRLGLAWLFARRREAAGTQARPPRREVRPGAGPA